MRVAVRLLGTLRRFSLRDTPGVWEGELPAGSSLRDLLRAIGAEEREVSAASVNGTVRPLDTEILEGAEILLVTPVGGG
jgi:sulfur carrier protein ThiS